MRPSLRGRGIATALKVRVISAARQRGESILHSSSGNPAMLKVNQPLGYRRTTTEVRLVRTLAVCETHSPQHGPDGNRLLLHHIPGISSSVWLTSAERARPCSWRQLSHHGRWRQHPTSRFRSRSRRL
jgi:hypothetical protein